MRHWLRRFGGWLPGLPGKVTALLGLALLWAGPVRAETWEDLLAAIRRRFPSVRQLRTEALAGWLADPARRPPLLVDARAPGEYAVSHLRDAIHAEDVKGVMAVLGNGPEGRGRAVVVYCSVGYRSSALAEKLAAAGFTNVFNLEGSIFAWANERRPVHRGTNTTTEVHPYSRKWGELLDPRYHPKSR